MTSANNTFAVLHNFLNGGVEYRPTPLIECARLLQGERQPNPADFVVGTRDVKDRCAAVRVGPVACHMKLTLSRAAICLQGIVAFSLALPAETLARLDLFDYKVVVEQEDAVSADDCGSMNRSVVKPAADC